MSAQATAAAFAAMVDAGAELVFGEVEINSARAVPIGDGACHWVVIQNPLANEDNTSNTIEIIYGDSAHQRQRILPGNDSQPLPFKSLARCFVKSAKTPPPDNADTALQISYYFLSRKP